MPLLAHYIDRILKGSPLGEMAVEQATRFYLTINLKAALALGLAVPREVMSRADEVIQ